MVNPSTEESIYGPGFRLTKTGVIGDYINAWGGHLMAHDILAHQLKKGTPLSDLKDTLDIIKQPIPKYENHVEKQHAKVFLQVMKDSNSSQVRKINALVQAFNKELRKGIMKKETFTTFYLNARILIFGPDA